MTKKRVALGITLALLFALFLVLRLPISTLGGWVLPKTLQLDSADGTLWHGRASAVGVNGIVLQQDVVWNVDWKSLQSGELAWKINGRLGEEPSTLDLNVSTRGMALANVQARLPVEPLLIQDEKLKQLGLGGMLKITAQRFSLEPGYMLSVRLENLFSTLAPNLGPLGTSDIQITTQANNTAAWVVRPVEGRLAITGQGQLDFQHNAVSGELGFKPDESLTGALRPVLSLLRQSPDGRYVVNLDRR